MAINKNEELVTTTVNLPKSTMASFRSMSKLLGVSLSQLTREAIEDKVRATSADPDYQSKVQAYLEAEAEALAVTVSN